MNKTKIIKTGTRYSLVIGGPTRITKNRISIGIRVEGSFNPDTNFIAVTLDKSMLEELKVDISSRCLEMGSVPSE